MAMKIFILCLLGIIVLGGATQVHAALRNYYKFEVINSSHTRLCTKKSMLTVNGQFPGPTIYARRGDLVIVDVINRAHQNITIHWHGVKMPRNPWGDGTDFVTQCPIIPGTKFRQRIILSDEEGTLWWHAHSDWSRATVYGAIIILPPKANTYPFPKPHAQVPILLGEWWNGDVQEIMEEFIAGGRVANQSDAFLINGQPGVLYPCSIQETFKLSVEVGKTYMMRMVNAMMNYIMYFKIGNHNFTVVGADGAYTKPFTTDMIAIPPGQTIDLLLEANQPPDHYYMAAREYALIGEYTPTTALIEYVGNYTPSSPLQIPSFPEYATLDESSGFTTEFINSLKTLANDGVPMNITEHLFYVVAINEFPCKESPCEEPERLLASVNNVSMLLPTSMDILDAYYRGIRGVYTTDLPDHPRVPFDYTHAIITSVKARPQFRTAVKMLEYNASVEIVFQATSFFHVDHPMHLHGHSFYIIGSGFGNFDPVEDPLTYNLVDPPFVSSVLVPRNGWATIRFKANNPGVWYMHCHFERHQSWGMNMVFIVEDGEAPDEKMLPPPPDMPRCRTEQLSSHPLLSSDQLTVNNHVDSAI